MPRCHRSLSQPHDPDLSRMLKVYVITGLAFMLLPGTFVGVLNLLKISSAHTSGAADAGWIQAHGHAQIFGWLGTFILGIGYYAIPRLRLSRFSFTAAWTTYVLWVAGVLIRWAVGTWPFQWRILFPLAGVLELIAVAVFAVSVYLSRPRAQDDKWRESVVLITGAGWMMVAAVAVNAVESFRVTAPVFPIAFNQSYLALITSGFVVPFIWGFLSRWTPPLLGLRKTRKALVRPTLALLLTGVALSFFSALTSAVVLLVASAVFGMTLRYFEPPEKEPKLRGVHPLTPSFIRIAYAWSIVAAAIAIVASLHPIPNGYAGASRHALTVGFFAATVFTIGPRVLPAFFNVRQLWSTRLMAVSIILLNIGCVIRVTAQILAYQNIAPIAWRALPLSAGFEMTAVTMFAVNLAMTLTTGSPLEAVGGAAQFAPSVDNASTGAASTHVRYESKS